MATHGTWHRQGLAIIAATTLIGSLTIWVTQVAIASPASATPVQASPYFAGAATNAPELNDGGLLTEEGSVNFVVPTVTCPAIGTEGFAVFQYLQDTNADDPEAVVDWVDLTCSSGTFTASMSASACSPQNSQCNAACFTPVSVAAGDTIRFDEDDTLAANGQPPFGLVEAFATDSTNGQVIDCESGTPGGGVPEGRVYTGACGFSTGGPIPPNAPPPPPFQECAGSGPIPASTPVALSGLKVDAKSISTLKTHYYDMYMYVQVGSTLQAIEQVKVKTQTVPKELKFVSS